jgi:hypothetical protein
VQCGNKFEIKFDGGDFGSKKCKRYMVAPMVGCGGDGLAGVWSQAVGFVLVSLAEIWLQSS